MRARRNAREAREREPERAKDRTRSEKQRDVADATLTRRAEVRTDTDKGTRDKRGRWKTECKPVWRIKRRGSASKREKQGKEERKWTRENGAAEAKKRTYGVIMKKKSQGTKKGAPGDGGEQMARNSHLKRKCDGRKEKRRKLCRNCEKKQCSYTCNRGNTWYTEYVKGKGCVKRSGTALTDPIFVQAISMRKDGNLSTKE